jgi:hypothetical protein
LTLELTPKVTEIAKSKKKTAIKEWNGEHYLAEFA